MGKITVTVDLNPALAAEVKRRFNGDLSEGINTLVKEQLIEMGEWKKEN